MTELNKHRTKDLTGIRFGRLVVEKFTGYLPVSGCFAAFWFCKCECGNTKVVRAHRLMNGMTKSCGCLAIETSTKHGKSGTREVKAWGYVKDRCYNKNSDSYADYGGAGILMDELFKEDFNAFFSDIGPMPDDGNWSVDRVDNNKGYVKGNIRWATPSQQARNRGKSSVNTSGVNGVYWKYTNGLLYAVAQWSEYSESKSKCKLFSVQKYGLLPSFAMACEYREQQIARLNSLGYGYSENHGK